MPHKVSPGATVMPAVGSTGAGAAAAGLATSTVGQSSDAGAGVGQSRAGTAAETCGPVGPEAPAGPTPTVATAVVTPSAIPRRRRTTGGLRRAAQVRAVAPSSP